MRWFLSKIKEGHCLYSDIRIKNLEQIDFDIEPIHFKLLEAFWVHLELLSGKEITDLIWKK